MAQFSDRKIHFPEIKEKGWVEMKKMGEQLKIHGIANCFLGQL
jgi:hypothetical protein